MSELDYRIGVANAALIEASSRMLANLGGVDVDSGTAGEIGGGPDASGHEIFRSSDVNVPEIFGSITWRTCAPYFPEPRSDQSK